MAVKVTDEPEMLGLALELTTVVVLLLVLPTVWVNELPVEIEKFASPEYEAVAMWLPTVRPANV